MEDNNGNNVNDNNELDFNSIPTLSEMKQKRYEQNGGDPMHELESHPNTTNNIGNKNADYNDLRYMHKSKIRNDNENYNYDMNNMENNNYSNNGNNSSIKKNIIIVVVIVVLTLLGGIVIRAYLVEKAVSSANAILSRARRDELRNAVTSQAEKEIFDETDDVLENYYYSQSKEAIVEKDLSDLAVKQYNSEFTIYDGEEAVKGLNISMLLKNVMAHNKTCEDSQIIAIDINASAADGTNYTGEATSEADISFINSDLLDMQGTYSVECKYDDEGYVYEIEIVEK